MIARTQFGWALMMTAVSLALAPMPAPAQPRDTTAIDSLRRRVDRVEDGVEDVESGVRDVRGEVQSLKTYVNELRSWYEDDTRGFPLMLFLIAVFCALWAQNTGRNAWLWFFMGGFFHITTLLVLLAKNAGDRRSGRPRPIHV